jgi:predicted AAA+ superfamily ATPase
MSYVIEICNQTCHNSTMIIPRRHHIDVVREALERSPIVAILGPRQIGKTTLAREIEALPGKGLS